MFRLWVREFKDNSMICDIVVEDGSEDTRTHKIFRAIEQACYTLDLSVPNWLDANIKEFKRISKVRFTQDNFPDEISFDYLEVSVIEE